MLGCFAGSSLTYLSFDDSGFGSVATNAVAYPRYNRDSGDNEDSGLGSITGRMVLSAFGGVSPEVKSPVGRVDEDQILVYRDKIVLDVEDATWAVYTDTNSMDPVLDVGAKGLEVVPKSPSEIHVGDIVSYAADGEEGLIVHRVNKIGNDEDGWYAILKGDNNPSPDPGKIRFGQIKYLVIGVIY